MVGTKCLHLSNVHSCNGSFVFTTPVSVSTLACVWCASRLDVLCALGALDVFGCAIWPVCCAIIAGLCLLLLVCCPWPVPAVTAGYDACYCGPPLWPAIIIVVFRLSTSALILLSSPPASPCLHSAISDPYLLHHSLSSSGSTNPSSNCALPVIQHSSQKWGEIPREPVRRRHDARNSSSLSYTVATRASLPP